MDIFKKKQETTKSTIEDQRYIIDTSKEKLRESPFQGPRPFSKSDRDWFFGRDEEAEEITSLILGHKCVLIYAKSGAGKSSLLNAKIIPELEEKGLSVLPVSRIGSALISKSLLAHNPYMSNALEEIIKDDNLPIECKKIPTDITLSQFLRQFVSINEEKNKNEKEEKKQKPYVIIFDQLEEIFNLYPDNWRLKQHSFFEQIASALAMDDIRLRVVLVIREDYVASLDPYSGILPEKLRQRLRIEPLTRDQAREAIENPLEKATNYYQDPNIKERIDFLLSTKVQIGTEQLESKSLLEKVTHSGNKDRYKNKSNIGNESNVIIPDNETILLIDKVINNLSSMRIETPEGKTTNKIGDFVEPIYLQVVCDKIWKKLILSQRKDINPQFLENLSNVDNALEELYEDAINDADEASSKFEVSSWFNFVSKKDRIRNWLEKKLITPNDTRGSAYKDPIKKEEIPEEALKVLENRYLIRVDRRPSGRWYELTHDTLIKPIKMSNEKRRKKNEKQKRLNILYTVVPSAFFVFILIILLNNYYNDLYLVPSTDAIAVENLPYLISLDQDSGLIYVTHPKSDIVSLINGKRNNVIKIISVLPEPTDITVDSKNNLVYVSHLYNKTISVIEGNSGNPIKIIKTDYFPLSLDINSRTSKLYVTAYKSSNVSVIDINNPVNMSHMTVGNGPTGLTVDEDNNLVYVANSEDNTVSVIDGNTKKVNAPIKVGNEPTDIAVDTKNNSVYVANRGDNTVSVINKTNNNLFKTIKVGISPSSIEIDPYRNRAYVTNSGDKTVSVIDLAKNLDTPASVLTVGNKPTSININLKENMLYVVNNQDNNIIALDIDAKIPKHIHSMIPVGIHPSEIKIDNTTQLIYVANTDSDTVSVIDGTKNMKIDEYKVGEKPSDIDIHNQKGIIYVSNSLSNTISIIDQQKKPIENIPTNGTYPTGLSVDEGNNLVYVANTDSDTVSVIDGNTKKVNTTIPVGNGPTDIAIDEGNNLVYVANYEDDTLSVINKNSLTPYENVISINKNHPGNGPTSLAVDTKNNKLYVINAFSDNLSIIDINIIKKDLEQKGDQKGDIDITQKYVITSLNVGNSPNDLSLDTTTKTIYVTNRNDNTTKILDIPL
jgi:YVTN family beta-propeller protein